MLLCGRPYWAECGEPFAPGLSRAAVGILLQQPVLVIARDEGPDHGANLLGIAENPAPHDLLLEGADEPLRHTTGRSPFHPLMEFRTCPPMSAVFMVELAPCFVLYVRPLCNPRSASLAK